MSRLTLAATFSFTSIMCLVGLAAPVAAQERRDTAAGSFADLRTRLKPGTFIFVVDSEGRETSGTLSRLSATSLVFADGGRPEIPFARVSRIEKRDPIWTGAVIGGGIGALLGSGGAAGVPCHTHCAGTMATTVTVGGVIGAAIGAFADRSVHGRTRIYSADSQQSSSLPPVAITADTGVGRSPGFGNLSQTVKKGDAVSVIDSSGHKTSGKLDRISGSSIVLSVDGQSREILEADVRRVERRRDSLWNGFAIGAALGLLAGTSDCGDFGPGYCAKSLSAGGLFFGGIGAGIDALIGRSKVAYVSRRPSSADVSPRIRLAVSSVLTPQRKAVGLAVSF